MGGGRRDLSVDLNGVGAGAISQELSGFQVGAIYQVVFAMGGNSNFSRASFHEMGVDIAGVSQRYRHDPQQGDTPQNFTWDTNTLSLVVGSALHTLTFTEGRNLPSEGAVLDNLRVNFMGGPAPGRGTVRHRCRLLSRGCTRNLTGERTSRACRDMKIGIVGAGMVGSAAAFAMIQQGLTQEIVLVDLNTARARAEAEDIAHAVPFAAPAVVRAGTYAELAGAALVVLACGVSQKPGETRLALLSRNAEVFRAVVGEVMAVCPGALLLVASNPVDIMGHITQRISGLPPGRVIASGTILDTARFRWLLGQHLGVAPNSVHGYVLGEHGDSEVLAWSNVHVGSVPLPSFAAQVSAPITEDVRARIDAGTRRAAYTIIEGKGATWYGIGGGLARIVRAIGRNEEAVLSVSIVAPDVLGVRDVAVSLPRVVGASGVTATLMPELDAGEADALRASAQIIKDSVEALAL